MKKITIKSKICLGLIICLLVVMFTQRNLILAIFNSPKGKNASIIVANDRDQTLLQVYDEFKRFDASGYASQEYPKLERLYCSRKSWRLFKIAGFSTSIKMQAYGAERDMQKGDWGGFISLLDDCITGYQQFIPFEQETSAITYLWPCLNLSKRIVESNNIAIPNDIKQQMVNRLIRLETLVKAAPNETTNNFKKQFLHELKEILSNLNNS